MKNSSEYHARRFLILIYYLGLINQKTFLERVEGVCGLNEH